MKYRIRKWISRNPNGGKMYYPQYKRPSPWWKYSEWQEGKGYETLGEARDIIDIWIEKGVPEESYYIKYP